MKKKSLSLRRVLAYKNSEIIARFCRDLGLSKAFGQTVFKDLLRYLYLTQRHHLLVKRKENRHLLSFSPEITDEMLIIDEMWHTFVQYTADYADFSFRIFGHYVHHAPVPTHVKKIEVHKMTPRMKKAYLAQLEAYKSFVRDELGSAVVTRWFKVYPKKFTKKKIRELKYKNGK